MNVLISNFDELTPRQLHDIFYLRQEVFILEQQCLYPDIDGYDDRATHIALYDEQNLAGYLRVFEPGVKFEEAALGRIVVDKSYRGSTIGPSLIKTGIDYCRTKFPNMGVRIEAQAALLKYYGQFGFKAEGKIYEVDGIDHIQMALN